MVFRPSKIEHQQETVVNSYNTYLGCLLSIKIISSLCIYLLASATFFRANLPGLHRFLEKKYFFSWIFLFKANFISSTKKDPIEHELGFNNDNKWEIMKPFKQICPAALIFIDIVWIDRSILYRNAYYRWVLIKMNTLCRNFN